MRRDNDYLELLPYREIGSSSSKKSAATHVARAAAFAVIFIGLPSLIIVPLMTYLFQGFSHWRSFLVGMAGNFVVPLAAIAAVTLMGVFAAALKQRR
ncbi:MAG: hypothetical protein ABMA01_00110 [Chthoniobacteraceae bacterium]